MVELLSDSIYGCFEEVSERNPDKPALICLGEKYSYSQLKEMVLRFAASLHHLGVREGDRVILYLYNLPQTIISCLALRRINAVPVMVAPVYTSYDLRYLANDSGAELVICMDTNLNYVLQVLPDSLIKKVIVTRTFDLIPWWKKLIARAFDRAPRGEFPSGRPFFSFRDLLRDGRPSGLPSFRTTGGHNTGLMLYTGGTTGLPKGVPIPEGLFLYKVKEWRRAEEGVIPPGEDVVILGGPLYHIIGQATMGAPLLICGESLIVFPRVVLDATFDHVQRYKGKSMFGVPAIYRMILEHDRVDHYDLSSFRYCGTGGDVLPLEVANRWFKKFGIPLYQGYGATETGGLVSICYSEDGQPPEGSAGRILPGIECKLVNSDTLEPVPPGEPGELLVTSPYAVRGYWNKPEETAECFFELEGKTWYRTKDMVRIDKDGFLYFEDRSADIIKHKGYRIAAAEVERVLQEHSSVVSACVVGIPDPMVGERIKAFVVLREDVKGISGHDLQRWCRDRLPPYKIPSYIEVRDMLPKSKVGKFLRRELRDEESRKMKGS
jgi:long-chain acyl-CoA synthetase